MRRIAPLVLAGSLLFAACGGDDDSAVTNDSIVLPAKESAATTEPALATTVPAAPVTPDSAGGPLVTPIEIDPCLVGTWNVSVETIGLLISAALLPVPDLTLADGGFTVTLNDDGTIAGVADFTAAFTFGEAAAEADVAWTASGTWTSFDGAITLSLDQQDGGITELRLDGVASDNGGVGSQVVDVELPLAGGPYTCTDTRLDVTGSAGGTTIPLVLER
ncbi:MAG: hypothetical protein NTZ21_09525 [Actinobacteria bacterium]|nr:hypothetical protein [Actinomycetota bacterium]